jgi:hypothetical protein
MNTGDPVQTKELGAPYGFDSNQAESVNLNTGGLVYERVDYVLPGRNGLDLVIGRRYDSDTANTFTPMSSGTLAGNSHRNEMFGLGHGWGFMFSSVQWGMCCTCPTAGASR